MGVLEFVGYVTTTEPGAYLVLSLNPAATSPIASIALRAFFGMALILGGSFYAIAAPGDGMTAMFTFPMWGIGGCLVLSAIVSVVSRRFTFGERSTVFVFALIAAGSVIWSFVASVQYSRGLEVRNKSENVRFLNQFHKAPSGAQPPH